MHPAASIINHGSPASTIGNPQFGQVVTLQAGRAARAVPVLNMPENESPRLWSVTLGIDFSDAEWPPAAGGPRGFNVVAEVEAGTGAGAISFEVDWVAGTVFTVPATTIKINATLEAFAAAPERVRVSAVIGDGTCPRLVAPTRSRRIGGLVNGAFSTVRVPPFGGSVMPVAGGGALALYDASNVLTLHGGPLISDVPVASTTLDRMNPANTELGMRIPSAARYATLQNASGADIADLSFVFGLAL